MISDALRDLLNDLTDADTKVWRLTTRIDALRHECKTLLASDAALRGYGISDQSKRIRIRFVEIKHEATNISLALDELGRRRLAWDAAQGWPLFIAPSATDGES